MISRKKNLSLIFLLTILTGSSIAQTNVSGGIYTNTTWTLAGSPYIVVDTVVVFPGVTLTIDPGVIVKFANGKYMEIRQASIMAVGNSTDSITFTSNSTFPTLGIWGKVWRSGGNMVCNFNYCNFKYSSQGIYGADTVKNSSFVFNGFGCVAHYLDSCSFRNNGTAARGDVYNSIIRNNQTGVSFGFNVKNCQIDSNQTGLDGSHTLIENSSLSYNQVGGTSSQYESNIYKNCVINYNTVKGVALMASNEDSVINCEIKFNGTGIDIPYSFMGKGILRNIIESNSVGVKMVGPNNSGSIYCNKICNNLSYDLQLTNAANLNAANNYWCTSDSISTMARIYDGYDNISLGLVNFMPLDTLMCYQGIPTVIQNTKNNLSLTIYPNPITSELTIQSGELKVEKIEMYNAVGERVKDLTPQNSLKEISVSIDISGFASGIYFVKVSDGKNVVMRKFVKM